MKGIIFNLLEEAVQKAHGEAVWEDLLDAAGVDGSYTSVGSYPDEDLGRLVSAAAAALGAPPDAIVRWFGRSAIPLLAARYPRFFEGHASTEAFLRTLNDVIHTEVRKIYAQAEVPHFEVSSLPDGRFSLGYASPRRLCALAEGMIEGAAAHFGEAVRLEQPTCLHRGDARCLIVCAFGARAS